MAEKILRTKRMINRVTVAATAGVSAGFAAALALALVVAFAAGDDVEAAVDRADFTATTVVQLIDELATLRGEVATLRERLGSMQDHAARQNTGVTLQDVASTADPGEVFLLDPLPADFGRVQP